jgi:hypothetical protein
MALLSGLDRVAWPELKDARGSAAGIPVLLRALVDPEGAAAELQDAARAEAVPVRQHAEDELWDRLYHHAELGPASAPAVPFLVELLRLKDVALRRFVLEVLRSLAEGHPEDRFPTLIDPSREFADPRLAARPALAWQRDCYRAVERAVPAVLFFVDDADEEVALLAMALVAGFPSAAARAVPRLRPVTKSTKASHAARVGTALVALAQLLGNAAGPDISRVMQAPRSPDSPALADALVPFFAACAAVLADPAVVAPRTVVTLTTLDEATARRKTPLCGTLAVLSARCLQRLPAYRTQAIHSIAQQHVAADPVTRLALSESLLSLAFGANAAPARAGELDLLQRYALDAVRDHGGWTISGVEFGNYTELMAQRGLPATRDALAAWLDG